VLEFDQAFDRAPGREQEQVIAKLLGGLVTPRLRLGWQALRKYFR
jgi:hypothetical protein